MPKRPKEVPVVPVHRLLPGQIWRVSIPFKRHPTQVSIGEPIKGIAQYYVLLVDGRPYGWPDAPYGLWMSRPPIGDARRPLEALHRDFRKLREQHPPHIANYVKRLDKYRGAHVTWEEEIPLQE